MACLTARAVVAQLVALLCLSGASGAQSDSGGPRRYDAIAEAGRVDIWSELKELRDAVVELRTELRAAGSELQSQGVMVDDLRRDKAVLETRLGASESRVDNLEEEVLRQRVELSVAAAELQNHKATAEDLKKVDATLWSKQGETESRVLAQDRETSTLKTGLAAARTANEEQAAELTSLESRVEALQREDADRPKVAFSAALKSTCGPGDLTVVYDSVVTNVGGAYSPVTGAFTAPVRGVYYFTAIGMDNRYDLNLHLDLFKNAQRIVSRWRHNNGGDQFVSVDLILELEVGDVVDTRISGSHRLVGGDLKPTTFSGCLLYPL